MGEISRVTPSLKTSDCFSLTRAGAIVDEFKMFGGAKVSDDLTDGCEVLFCCNRRSCGKTIYRVCYVGSSSKYINEHAQEGGIYGVGWKFGRINLGKLLEVFMT
jgi:hypothetical protein